MDGTHKKEGKTEIHVTRKRRKMVNRKWRDTNTKIYERTDKIIIERGYAERGRKWYRTDRMEGDSKSQNGRREAKNGN